MNRCARIALLSLCLAVGSNAAHATRQEQLEHLRKRISALQQEVEKTTESKSAATEALRKSELAISESNRKLYNLARQHRQATQALQKMQKQSTSLTQNVETQRALLGKLLYQQYMGGRQQYLKLLLSNRNPDQVTRDLQYYEYITRGRANLLHALRSDLAQVNALADQTREKNAEIAKLQGEAKLQKRHLERDRRARKRVLRKYALQLRRQRHEIGRLQRNENRLSQLVDKLSDMLSRPKSVGIYRNNQLPDDRFDGKPFASLKGRLSLPVKGVVTNRFGAPHRDSRVRWKGLFVRAAAGRPVKAVAAGRVVFADWLRGFGNLLIIDHGKGYMSLYGDNETLYKQVGDTLKGGDTVAAVGNTGGNEDSGLYFELRYRGKPMDPMKWVAKK